MVFASSFGSLLTYLCLYLGRSVSITFKFVCKGFHQPIYRDYQRALHLLALEDGEKELEGEGTALQLIND
jgi:hypothetical protein